jgi:hypothetical protein
MPTPPLSEALMVEALEAVATHGTVTSAAVALGISRGTLQGRYRNAVATLGVTPRKKAPEYVLPQDVPDEAIPTADLLKQRSAKFQRLAVAKEARRILDVPVMLDGPIGIAHFGDPHVDDDGTNIDALQRHVELVNKTPGLLAGNVGDYHNNWIGRLARLYGEQSTSAKEAWQLVEWLIHACPWLYLVGGNHDAWSGTGDPLKWITKQTPTLYQPNGVRMRLKLPSGRDVRINARHDFKGHSQWNTAHGPSKAAQMGWRDHILTCGHTHVSGYQVVRDPSTRLISHALRVGSYKTYDRYADELGLPDQNIFVCPVTIIDPRWAEDDPRFITVLFDPEHAADYLTFLRKKKAA